MERISVIEQINDLNSVKVSWEDGPNALVQTSNGPNATVVRIDKKALASFAHRVLAALPPDIAGPWL